MKNLTIAHLYTVLAVWIAFVFLQSGFFKFSGADETVHIFTTVGAWMGQALNPFLGQVMTQYGAIIIGLVEVVASVLLLIPVVNQLRNKPHSQDGQLTFFGALAAFGVMCGAIFFHLFTPLGIDVQGDGGTLFTLALTVWFSSLVLMKAHYKAAF